MRRSPFALSALLVTTACPALADITPEEVWADWQRLLSNSDATVTVGREDSSRNALTLNDVTLEFDLEDEGEVAGTIPEIVFEDRGDGTVEITMSGEYPLALSGKDPETGDSFSMDFTVDQSGLVTIASRDGETTRYDYVGPGLSMTVGGLRVDDEEVPFDINVGFDGIKGAYSIMEGTPRLFESDFNAEALTLAADGSDPEEPSAKFSLAATVADISAQNSGTIAGISAFGDMSTLLDAGYQADWTFTHGAAEYSVNGSDDQTVFNMLATAADGDFSGTLSPDGLDYGGGNTGLEVAISSSDIPFPEVTFGMEATEGRLTMPVVPGDEFADFGLLMRMDGLEISDAIWGMFDPTGQLPRDPASLVLDLGGKARWLVDVFDPAFAEAGSTEVPGEVENLDLKVLRLTVAGAELAGDGSFEFDNSGSGPFAPAPSPSGTLNLSLSGGNALLDTLVNMGLLPQEQAMGARMMMGLFARPGNGPDELVSTIEVGKDGSVSANGQRIR